MKVAGDHIHSKHAVSINHYYHYVLGMDSFNLDLRQGSPSSSVHGIKQLKYMCKIK